MILAYVGKLFSLITGHSHSVAMATFDSLTFLRSRNIGQSICAVHRYFTSSDVSSPHFPSFTVYIIYNSPSWIGWCLQVTLET